jgi:hypothetical protein
VQVQSDPDGMLTNALSIAQHEAARLRLEVLSLDAQLQVGCVCGGGGGGGLWVRLHRARMSCCCQLTRQ